MPPAFEAAQSEAGQRCASIWRARDAFGSWLRRHALFDLPFGLGALYFLNSCTQSFPLTANQGFLNEELRMAQDTQSLYYAVTFMPWSLKPLYGLLADSVPICGYHFRPWLVLSSAGSAVCYLLMATCVHTVCCLTSPRGHGAV